MLPNHALNSVPAASDQERQTDLNQETIFARHPVRILHIITGLESGGAERILFQLASQMDRERFACEVVSLTTEGPSLGRQLRHLGIPVHSLGFRRGIPDPRLLFTLATHIRKTRPDLIQTWLHHADLAGGIAARISRTRAPVLWATHNTELDPQHGKRQTIMIARLNARLAKSFSTAVICCSKAVLTDNLTLGYPAERLCVINNGVDTLTFHPDLAARAALRQELGLAATAEIIGLIARFDPQKDHQTFCRAAGVLHRTHPQVHFVLCGSGITPANDILLSWIRAAGVEDNTHLLGLREDIPRVTAALDVATCCSRYGESFALVLAEAMACGIPCVTSDMPGPISVVGDTGRVVPRSNAEALALAWQELLALSAPERLVWGERARQRAVDSFSLSRMVSKYESLYKLFLSAGTGGSISL